MCNAQFSSLGVESSFSEYLVRKLRSLNYPCIFVDENVTSQICPNCTDRDGDKRTKYVKKCGFRVKYCENCKIYFNRDIMAAENMVNKAQSLIFNDSEMAKYLERANATGDAPGASDQISSKKGKGKRKLDGSSLDRSEKKSRRIGDDVLGNGGHVGQRSHHMLTRSSSLKTNNAV